jgi:hypothetical protein
MYLLGRRTLLPVILRTNARIDVIRAKILRDSRVDTFDYPPTLCSSKILAIVNFQTITEMDFRSLLDFACHFILSVTPEGTICIFEGMPLT